jgi:hypothetical protein
MIDLETTPFPTVPVGAQRQPLDSLRLRPFGELQQDLDVDFDEPHRAELVTRLLQTVTVCSSGDVRDDFFWDLPQGKRVQALLAVAAMGADPVLRLRLECQAENCRKPMEAELSMGDLVDYQRAFDRDGPLQVKVGDRTLSLRLPTGRDQKQWALDATDGEPTFAHMLRELTIDADRVLLPAEIPADWVTAVEGSLSASDPLIDFTLRTQCPECGSAGEHEVDLLAVVLHRMRRAQRELLQTVHRLASAYHWSEAEILAMPAARRRRYLSLIGEGS